jgi:hypothetical protein
MFRTARLTGAILVVGLLALVAWGWHVGLGPVFARTTNEDFGLGNPREVVTAVGPVIDVGDKWFCDRSYEDGVCVTTVNAGETVTWQWVGRKPHTTTACGGSLDKCPKPRSWDSPVQESGAFSYTFDSAGTFFYRCQLHPDEMRGQIVVLAAPPSPPPDDPPSPPPDDPSDPPPDNPSDPPPDDPSDPPPDDPLSPAPDNPPSPAPGSAPASTPTVVLSDSPIGPTASAGGMPDTGGPPPPEGPDAALALWLALAAGGALVTAGIALAARGMRRRS